MLHFVMLNSLQMFVSMSLLNSVPLSVIIVFGVVYGQMTLSTKVCATCCAVLSRKGERITNQEK